MIDIPTNLTPGSLLWLDEQAFEFAGLEPHRKQDGSQTELRRWLTNCAVCEQPFEALTPAGPQINTPSRRCRDCVRPGKPVVGKRGRKLVVRIEEL